MSLLLLLAASLLLFLSSSSSNVSRLHELLNHALLLISVFNLHGPPHLLNFVGSLCLRLLFHPFLLVFSLLLQVVFGEGFIFIAHALPLTPLTQPVLIVHGFVPSQESLNRTDIFKAELVEAKFKIYQSLIDLKHVFELGADLGVESIVGHVQAEQSFVVFHGFNHLFNTVVLLPLVRQVVRLEVQVLKCFVVAQGEGKDASRCDL